MGAISTSSGSSVRLACSDNDAKDGKDVDCCEWEPWFSSGRAELEGYVRDILGKSVIASPQSVWEVHEKQWVHVTWLGWTVRSYTYLVFEVCGGSKGRR